ncbi:MAG: ATPase, T2SS/T4P/T4SS family [Candidatus Omnitrophica bacterium]|nr:ATPase, T2SS/T4P/T4SS family [Candidatus Omnitrophota bacterium]
MSILTDALLKEGLVTQEQLNDAKAKSEGAKRPLQELLIEMGFVKEEELLKLSARIFKMPIIDLTSQTPNPDIIKLIPFNLAQRYGVFPVKRKGDTLVLAMSDPRDILALDDIKVATHLNIEPILSPRSQINKYVETYYQTDESVYDILKNVVDDTIIELIREDEPGKERFDTTVLGDKGVPVVRLANLIFRDAVKAKASDIHIEPQERAVKVRYRIDGELRNIMDVPLKLHLSLVTRIKILAQLDIAETRKPQDGRAKIVVNNRKIDLRISTIPTFYGEKVELRLLDQQEAKTELDRIGFREDELRILKESVIKSQGIILVTGPTGSGKTSTLYAILNYIKSESKNIVTIEDPVEYLISGISQIQVNPVKDVTFASGLRSILRQDPNVILVGEIRDRDTADIAFRASLTGHLVFSTLHTNNAVASITRLLDIGLEPYLISSSIILIISQRLVKLICVHCKEEYTLDLNLMSKFKAQIDGLKINKFYHGKGCKECDFSGYRGRTAIFEILRFDEKIRRMVAENKGEDEILMEAKNSGLKTLACSGMERVRDGLITLDEVLRIAGIRDEAEIPTAASGVGIKILISDDEEDILRVLDKRLKSVGYSVILTRDGQEAVERVNKEKPDLVITDATMPKMNGFEVVKELRSRLETGQIPIIMLTGRQDKESEIQGLDAGADDYITKPFDADKLLARIKMLLRRREAKNG